MSFKNPFTIAHAIKKSSGDVPHDGSLGFRDFSEFAEKRWDLLKKKLMEVLK